MELWSDQSDGRLGFNSISSCCCLQSAADIRLPVSKWEEFVLSEGGRWGVGGLEGWGGWRWRRRGLVVKEKDTSYSSSERWLGRSREGEHGGGLLEEEQKSAAQTRRRRFTAPHHLRHREPKRKRFKRRRKIGKVKLLPLQKAPPLPTRLPSLLLRSQEVSSLSDYY